MKFPSKGSCAAAICDALYQHGPMTAAGVHAAVPPRFNHSIIAKALVTLQDNGCITRQDVGGIYLLTTNATRHLDQCELIAPQQAVDPSRIATPRTVPPFRPMTYRIETRGIREGSNDHLKYKSRHS
jgi:hypothetical protein